MARIFLSPPDVGEHERKLLLEAFDSNWIAPTGPDVDRFETEVAKATSRAHGAALSSGTAALHLSLVLLGVPRESDVIVPSLTFIAPANAAIYVGACPVFIDSSRDTWTLDPSLLEEELRARSRGGRLPAAVVSVDLFGQCADYDAIEEICARFEVPLIEDAAEALGSSYRDHPAGSFGALSAVSFNGNKIITTSGGGMLLGDEEPLIERSRRLSAQAREPAVHYEHEQIGFNYRLSNLLAALGRAQLADLDRRVERRRELNRRYREALEPIEGVELMPEAPYGRSNHWLSCILIDADVTGIGPQELMITLEQHDIESRPTWKPLHLQPVFRGYPRVGGSVSADIFARGLCLPSGSSLTDSQQDRVIDIMTAQLRRR